MLNIRSIPRALAVSLSGVCPNVGDLSPWVILNAPRVAVDAAPWEDALSGGTGRGSPKATSHMTLSVSLLVTDLSGQ